MVEQGPSEEVGIYDGYLHPYPEYDDVSALDCEVMKRWEELQVSTSPIKIILLNLQLKDDTIRDLTEISSLNKVRYYLVLNLVCGEL